MMRRMADGHMVQLSVCVSCQHISFGKMTLLFRLLDSLAGKRQCRCHYNGDSIWAEVSGALVG